MYGLRQYRHLLLGYQFLLRTDHAALTYLRRTPEPVGQSARYLDKLAEYDFELQHRPGAQHQNADALSRRPCERTLDAPPCNQCKSVVASTEDTSGEQVRALQAGPSPGSSTRKARQLKDQDDIVDPQGQSLLSKELLCEHQNDDPVIRKVISWLQTTDMAPTDQFRS